MADQQTNRSPEERRKRINRLKKIIIGFILVAIIIPIIICICLGVSLHKANKHIKELQKQLDEFSVSKEVVDDTDVSAAVLDDGASVAEEASVSVETTYTGTGNENANSSRDAETVDGIKRVYLTFDDGPSSNTDEILDLLKKYNVKATFFVVGNTSDHGKDMMKRIVSEGHTLGVHSFSHKYGSIYDSKEAFFEDYNEMADFIKNVTGTEPTICRLPGGSSNTVSKIDMADLVRDLNGNGITCFDWNISGGDATGQGMSAEAIADNVLSGVDRFQTAVVLLHDGADKRETVKAVDKILSELTGRNDIIFEAITDETPVILHIAL